MLHVRISSLQFCQKVVLARLSKLPWNGNPYFLKKFVKSIVKKLNVTLNRFHEISLKCEQNFLLHFGGLTYQRVIPILQMFSEADCKVGVNDLPSFKILWRTSGANHLNGKYCNEFWLLISDEDELVLFEGALKEKYEWSSVERYTMHKLLTKNCSTKHNFKNKKIIRENRYITV